MLKGVQYHDAMSYVTSIRTAFGFVVTMRVHRSGAHRAGVYWCRLVYSLSSCISTSPREEVSKHADAKHIEECQDKPTFACVGSK